ncbi:hypothetical protein BY458DRAFT_496718 [Sporodiniella umbellata]|nr:hypothetical protein BY458DRAFT_496718 [Sporodiniella umbellata]
MVLDLNHSTSPMRKSDPFAGMNTSVSYEKEIEKLKQQIVKKPLISRSSTPDSDAESVSSSVSEAEKARFLTFVRNWTGHWKGWEGTEMNSGSLWSDQSPWNTTIGKPVDSKLHHV